MLGDHNKQLRLIIFNCRRQIKEREESENLKKRETLEDGRLLKQKLMTEKDRVEEIKQKKMNEIKGMNVADKYLFDLEKFKIT